MCKRNKDELAARREELAAMAERLANAETLEARVSPRNRIRRASALALSTSSAIPWRARNPSARQTTLSSNSKSSITGARKFSLNSVRRNSRRNGMRFATAPRISMTACAQSANPSRKCARIAASAKSKKRATIPTASICARLASPRPMRNPRSSSRSKRN